MKKAVLCGLCFGESFSLSSRKFQEAPAWELKCPQLQAVESTQRILGTVHLRGNVRSHGLSQEKAWLTRKPPSLGVTEAVVWTPALLRTSWLASDRFVNLPEPPCPRLSEGRIS